MTDTALPAAEDRFAINPMYLFRWEDAAVPTSLLCPEGIVKLNRTAGEIIQTLRRPSHRRARWSAIFNEPIPATITASRRRLKFWRFSVPKDGSVVRLDSQNENRSGWCSDDLPLPPGVPLVQQPRRLRRLQQLRRKTVAEGGSGCSRRGANWESPCSWALPEASRCCRTTSRELVAEASRLGNTPISSPPGSGQQRLA